MSTALANCLRYNTETIQYSLHMHQLACCPHSVKPMRSHEGACLHFTTPHYHVLSDCRPLHFPSLRYSGASQSDRIKVTQPNHLQYLHKNSSIKLLIVDSAIQWQSVTLTHSLRTFAPKRFPHTDFF